MIMKRVMLLAVLAIVLLTTAPVMAANTIVYGEGTYTITFTAIDTDWLWTDTFPVQSDGISIIAIRFNPGAASDQCIINAGTVSGPDLFDSSVAASTADGTIQYYDPSVKLRPVLDVSDGTYNAGAKLTIILGK